ncbi:hypothetical protein Q3W71_20995 [Micromonospora sp. C28SCA-DRY-2]|uniref:hypothetical protein n=1 Tax=Micromonospora sp. C28SCA-DRY-2 TaxID=3059522 RepID=UPI00267674C4|nr:hypothetical protein [Micromonospora sp. C28SCA-DRY-2]MDO3704145.1 hypothetical protein [Micromonospora sp. C28SCA-DRY-2]
MTERRRPAAAVAGLLAVVAGIAGCGGDRPVSPLPVQPPAPVAAGTTSPPGPPAGTPSAPPTPPGPSTAAPTTRRPAPAVPPPTTPGRGTRSPSPTPACHGPIRYDIVLAETELELIESLCFAAGAVLRIQGIGPGLVTVDREDLVSRHYEAGVVDIRFVRTGTVAVTIPKDGREHTITVVVV